VPAYLKLVKLSEVSEVFNNMEHGAAGSNLITLKIFRGVYPVVCMGFVFLINECFKFGIFPYCLKKAHVKSLFKGVESENMEITD